MIDGFRHCNWNRETFAQMRRGGVTAVHVTVSCRVTSRATVSRVGQRNRLLERDDGLILHRRTADGGTLIDAGALIARYAGMIDSGVAVEGAMWQRLQTVAGRVLVPRTAGSRERGAGGGDAND